MKLLIKNGRVVDPASGRDERADIAIAAGRIVAIGKVNADFHASRTIDAMVLAGLVERHTPDNDLRRREVVLTPAGRDLLLTCWPQMEAFHAIVAQGISDEDLATTRRVLLAMTANLRT